MRRRDVLGAVGGVFATAGCLKLQDVHTSTSSGPGAATPATGHQSSTVTTAGTSPPATRTESLPDGIAWAFESYARIEVPPVLVEDTLYVGSYDRRLYALDTGTGEVRWSVHVGEEIDSTPVVADDTVYVATLNGTAAIDRHSGEVRWETAVGQHSPAVRAGTLYVDGESGLHALDPASGSERWVYPLDDQSSQVHRPAAHDGVVCFPTGTSFGDTRRGHLHGVDAGDGSRVWRTETSGTYFHSDFRPWNGHAVGFGKYTAGVVSISTGEFRWRIGREQLPDGTQFGLPVGKLAPVVVGTDLYLPTWSGLWKLDVRTGSTVWRTEKVASPPPPVPHGGKLYVTSGGVSVVDPSSGEIVRSYEFTGDGGQLRFHTMPAVDEDRVYVGAKDNRIYALER